MRPGDQLVCALIEPRQAGDTFERWPLHVTIVPWFMLTVSLDDFVRLLQSQLRDIAPFGAKVRYAHRFGYRKANVLLRNQWQPLHDIVLGSVQQAAKNRVPFRFVGRLYRPHVTHQASEHLNEGDIFWCDKVYVIEQKGGHKQVAAVIRLGNEDTTRPTARAQTTRSDA